MLYRWARKFNWKGRALDFDSNSNQILQRELMAHRIKFQKRSLMMADPLDDKAAQAIALLQVGKVVKVEGKPGEEQTVLTITPSGIVRILEVSQRIQSEILGSAAEDRVADIHVHFTNYEDDPDVAQTQPEEEQQ